MPNSFAARLPLARFEVDRDAISRERENLLDELWADPATRVLPIFRDTALLSSPTSLALVPVGAIEAATDARPELLVYLGRSTSTSSPEPAGTPILAALLGDAGSLADSEWGGLRALGHQLSDRDAGLLTEALGIINWHAVHQFSPKTGELTVIEKAGWVRRDPVSGTEIFPRTDPAIIVGVTDSSDRILLGSNAMWESNRFSLLAGFVEPGESLESAVAREIQEESGLTVIEPRYLGSQPWPFPASLMVGFTARVDEEFSGAATPDGSEILELRWFSREQLAGSLDDIILPGRTSIARAIIEEWYGDAIDDGPW